MHVVVTGGCGYIGSVLVPKLLNAGYKVTVIDIQWFGNYLSEHPNLNVIKGDIRDIESIDVGKFDTIIHLANIANDPCGDLNSKASWEVNVLASRQLAEWTIKSGAKQFIFSSSGSVYGVKEEPQVTEELSLVPISDYNKTKMVSERVLLSYKDDITVQCIRPATVCGFSPRMRLDVSVNMLTMQALMNKRITVFGGKQVRPNIHIQDITDVFKFFLETGDKNPGIFNAGFENISILDIAERITKVVPAEIVVTPSNDPRSYRLNSDKLLSTGFKPSHDVAYAIDELIKQFNSGNLIDKPNWYNIKTMKSLAEFI